MARPASPRPVYAGRISTAIVVVIIIVINIIITIIVTMNGCSQNKHPPETYD